MVERDTYTGSVELFFATLERALPHVDEPSVLRLMDFQVAKIGPSQPAWVTVLSRFVQRFVPATLAFSLPTPVQPPLKCGLAVFPLIPEGPD